MSNPVTDPGSAPKEPEAIDSAALSPASLPLLHFSVIADPHTREWIGQAVPTWRTVYAAEWIAKQDTETEHYDLFEVPDVDESGNERGTLTTFAITVFWKR